MHYSAELASDIILMKLRGLTRVDELGHNRYYYLDHTIRWYLYVCFL